MREPWLDLPEDEMDDADLRDFEDLREEAHLRNAETRMERELDEREGLL